MVNNNQRINELFLELKILGVKITEPELHARWNEGEKSISQCKMRSLPENWNKIEISQTLVDVYGNPMFKTYATMMDRYLTSTTDYDEFCKYHEEYIDEEDYLFGGGYNPGTKI